MQNCNNTNSANLVDLSNIYYTDIFPIKENSSLSTREFLQRVIDICLEFIDESNDRSRPILRYNDPDEMKTKFNFNIGKEPINLEQIVHDCAQALYYQVRTAHPHYFNQLSCGLDIVSLAGEWLTAAANTNMFTYEIAPVFILMEHEVLKKMRHIIGFYDGDSILAPGGAISNLYAVIAARQKMFPEYKSKGLRALPQQLVLFTSEHSHYSIKSAGAVCGFGTDNVIEVPCDERGKMIPSELEKLVKIQYEMGNRPYFVNCTCGTTVLGAFDPINPIADICDKYNLWLHVDAAWGGGLLLSSKQRHKLDHIERAQSVTWNPHKLMGTLLQCSTIHFKQDDKHYDTSYDTGDKVIQCGRHNDIFKLWIMWRSKGDKGYERHIDHLFEMRDYMLKGIKARGDKFHMVLENPECVNVSFWYIPSRLRNVPHDDERIKELGRITPILKARMMQKGTLMISYQPLGDIPNFFRNIISNSGVQKKDVDFLLDELDRLGHDL
ncbi:glutamate decarboxylase isoform X2 [Dermatophagoides farinae]|uniref:glutamate decarboxylase isoform X2 n=1 Tax=Dermatophagoides farinae TaxID=6954 RepID=UPI001F0D77BB|nr:glutamate decarboxylase-like isoform X2 [Dermatophagoides farinae]